MPEPRNRQWDYAVYLLARLGVAIVQALPVGLAYCLAGLIGDILYRLVGTHRKRALAHLRLSFPDWSADRCRRVAKASARNLVYLALEVLLTTRKISPSSWRRHVRLKDMAPMIRLLVQRPSGLILVTGHFGNWEVAGYMTAAIGLPTLTIARYIKNPYLNGYVNAVRERAGQRMVEKSGAAAEVEAAMARRDAVSVVFDQDAGRKGIFVDFFGRPASTFKSVGLMAMLYQAPVAVVYCRRLDRAYRFEVTGQRVIHPHEWADKDDPLQWITQEYTAALEQVVRTDPAQYFWVHRRWKHRPPGQPPPPGGIG